MSRIEVGKERAYTGVTYDMNCTHAPRIRVLVYSGYERKGEADPTDNGILLLDEESKQVVLDRHMADPIGQLGASARQVEEASRIASMSSEDLCLFIDSHPRARITCSALGL